ncbi:hypothetical protein [Microbacterium arborescens]|uniref:hypothetical protein n=1 Tax=Microbacterium arborescens TaxID=33883 RepID=UPI003C782F86
MTDQWLERVNRALRQYDMGLLDVRGVAEVLIPEPPTDDEGEALVVRPGDGQCPRCGTLPLLDVHVCAFPSPNRGRGPITDELIKVAARAYADDEFSDGEWEWLQTQPEVLGPYLDGMRAALEAYEAARNAEAGR